MKQLYHMSVTIIGANPDRFKEIGEAAEAVWPFGEYWYQDADEKWGAANIATLGEEETEEDFVERLAKAIWRANGKLCMIEVVAVRLRRCPPERFKLDEFAYERVMGQPAAISCEGDYEMAVTIVGANPTRIDEVRDAVCEEWPFGDWYEESEDEWSTSGRGTLGDEKEEKFAEHLAGVICRANGAVCRVEVRAMSLKKYETYLFDDVEEYVKLMKSTKETTDNG